MICILSMAVHISSLYFRGKCSRSYLLVCSGWSGVEVGSRGSASDLTSDRSIKTLLRADARATRSSVSYCMTFCSDLCICFVTNYVVTKTLM